VVSVIAMGRQFTKTGSVSMPALAELSSTESLPDEFDCEGSEDDQAAGERISSRGLEILRILNDVFNGLPLDATVATSDRRGPRA